MLRTTVQHAFVLAAFAILGSGCSEDERLTRICPETCYTGDQEKLGIGACKAGVPVCDSEGNVLSCEGEVLESPEVCDAVDNDCDGEVDEVLTISPWEDDNRCLQCGKCRQTRERCDPETGTWYCDYQEGPPAASDSVCDGIDEDCDCEEDEDVYPDDEVVFCYTGPDDTVTNGECRPGIEACINGETVCDGETKPTTETCDGVDNDCDGWVDNVTEFYEGVDLVFAIDTSGSMGGYIDAVTNVVCDYAAATEGREDLVTKMGLVLIATPDGDYSLAQNLTDAQTLCEALQDLDTSGGNEPTLSAAEAVSDPDNPLFLDWSPGSKRIFIGFGDEAGQVHCPESGGAVTMPCDPDEVVTNTLAYCVESTTDIYWFVGENSDYYVEQALGCGGDIFWLTSHEDFLMDQLNTILEEVCLEEPQP